MNSQYKKFSVYLWLILWLSIIVNLNNVLANENNPPCDLIPKIPLANMDKACFVRMDRPESKASYQTNYMDVVKLASKGRDLHFKDFPIPVYIEPLSDNYYIQACLDAFKTWQQESHNLVLFTFVTDTNQARIIVIWRHLGIASDDGTCALGAHTITKFKKESSNKVGMVIAGGIPIPIVSPNLSLKYEVPPQVIEVNLDLIEAKVPNTRLIVLKNIITHEVGHALGLLGHSPYRADMMYSITDEYSHISKRDLTTLQLLYSKTPDIPL